MTRAISLVVALALTTTAHANDPDSERPIGNGMTLVTGPGGNIFLTKGTQRTRLANGSRFKSLVSDAKAKTVTVTVEDYTCVGESTHTWTFAHLEARLANAAAYALHVKKDYKGAATGFARAVALDPKWNIPAYNLASARQLLGDKAAAVAALAPWISAEPIATYLHVVFDPELAPLLDQPALVALRAAKPGAARADKVLVAPERGLVAFARTEHSWGSSQFMKDIEIWDPAKRVRVASVNLVKWDDTDPGGEKPRITSVAKKRVAARTALLEQHLTALGFRPAQVEQSKVVDEDANELRFAKAKLGVASPDASGVATVQRGTTTVGTAQIEGRMMRAFYIVDTRTVVIEMKRHEAEGCDGGPEKAFAVVPVR